MTTYVDVTIVAYGTLGAQDLAGIEAAAPGAKFVSLEGKFGQTATFRMTGGAYARLLPLLERLSQKRIPAVNLTTGEPLSNGKTMPLCTYSSKPVPGGRPHIYQIEGGPLSLGAPADITLRGTGLVPGIAASLVLSSTPPSPMRAYAGRGVVLPPVQSLRLDAVHKGPRGNQISLTIHDEAAAPSVVVRETEEGANIAVTPATGASTSTAIAALINGNAEASALVTATALVPNVYVPPTRYLLSTGQLVNRSAARAGLTDRIFLSGGMGAGVAYLPVQVVPGVNTNRLHLRATRSGNDRNMISFALNLNQPANSVVVTGDAIVVNRTAASETIANIAAALAASPQASALVVATAVGAGSFTENIPPTYLFGGAGEPAFATIGGANTTIVSQSDTEIVLRTTNAALTAAGAAVGDLMEIQLTLGVFSERVSLGPLAA